MMKTSLLRCKKEMEESEKYVRKPEQECSVCGQKMREHPRCAGCQILCGAGHLSYASTFREHELCGRCIRRWEFLEQRYGVKLNWQQFQRGYAKGMIAIGDG